MDKQMTQAVTILNQGGIVIFPTDTAFGIGCRIDDEAAVQKLFQIRRRPQEKATPVLVDTVTMAQRYLEPIPQDVMNNLIESYWPGALTIVLKCKVAMVPHFVRGGGETLGVRIPNHLIARQLIREVGIPVLGPSANFAGEKTPFSIEDLDSALTKQVDFVVEGVCTLKKASTVIDCSAKPWKILRQGALQVSSSML